MAAVATLSHCFVSWASSIKIICLSFVFLLLDSFLVSCIRNLMVIGLSFEVPKHIRVKAAFPPKAYENIINYSQAD